MASQTKAVEFSAEVKALLERTGYTIDVSPGQRLYSANEHEEPGTGQHVFNSQIYIGKLPLDMYEDRLIPELEAYGTVYALRLMADSTKKVTKGYAFCMYTTEEAASAAV